MKQVTLLGISGSLRKEATNRKLIREAARLFGPSDYIEADIDMPLYDGDLEAKSGVPAKAATLSQQIVQADAVVISTPEYNKGPSGVLKNALDWVSRIEGHVWSGKPVAVMSAAAGRAGGERAQMVLRSFMVPFRVKLVTGPEIHLAASSDEFDENGHLKSDRYAAQLEELMQLLRAEISPQ